MTWLKNIKRNFPQGSAIKNLNDPNIEPGTGPAITPVVEEGVIPSDMTTGRSGHLDEVVLTAKPKKTRTEHRLDKTQSKGEAAAEAGNYNKANRLQRRKQRLLNKVERQEGKDKKKYVRKDKAFWGRQEDSPTKHLVDAKGKPKSKTHLSKHKAGHWGPEGHGDRSASGIAAGVINKGKKVVNNAKTLLEETKSKIK
jgi:hypothetical protein